MLWKYVPECLFILATSSFGEHKLYPSQTKILEGGTKDEMRIFEALVKDMSTQFGQRTSEKSVENPHFVFCSCLQNLRLESINFRKLRKIMLPKQRFCKDEQNMKCGFSNYFSMICGPKWDLTPSKVNLKSAFHLLFLLPNSSLGSHNVYAFQTKILDGWTKRCVCVFERDFNHCLPK